MPLRKGELLDSSCLHQGGQSIISFDATRLVINPVFLIALLGELLLDGPRTSPHGRVFDGDLVLQRLGSGARPTLDEMQVVARAQEIGFGAEVRNINDESIAVPVAARIAVPLADACGKMWASVHNDVALPALALTDVIKHGDAAGRLHNAAEAAAVGCSEFGQAASEATVRQGAIFRIIVAIHARGIVARRRIRAVHGGRGIIFSAGTGNRLGLASLS